MEAVKLKDFLDFKFLSEIKLSKNGLYAAYTLSKCNIDSDNYDSKLCINDLKNKGHVVNIDRKIRTYCWDNSDYKVLFGVNGEEDRTDFHRTNTNTMETSAAFTIDKKVGTIEYIGQGKYLYSARVNIKNNQGNDDCIIIDELPIQANGEGYTSGSRISLFIYDELTGNSEKILADKFEVMDFSYYAQTNKIVVVGHEYEDVRIIKSGIYMYDISKSSGFNLLDEGSYRISYASMFNEEEVLFIGTLGKNHSIMENPYFYKLNIKTREIKEFSRPDYYVMGLGVASDSRYGKGTTCTVYGDNVYFTAADHGSCNLFKVNKEGEVSQINSLEGSVDFFDITNNEAVFIGMRGNKLQELYKINLEDGQETQLTYYNEDYVNNHSVNTPIALSFTNKDGVDIHGWVLKPTNYDESKSYPGILNIHGGPKTAYGTVYFHEMQVWSNEGYFIFYCNPRGSDGRGDEFSRIMGRNGTLDYEDIMEFTSHVLEKYPSIDKDRLGVTGGSYGGYLTNMIVGKTDLFEAAATQRSIGDWIVHEYAADTGYWVTSEAYPPNSIVEAKKAWSQSPGKYAINIKTPILFIHSDEDLRCPLSEAMSVYAGAMRNDADVRMCLFHGENHELSRSGKPSNRVKRLLEITRWMDKYLSGGSYGY